MGQPPAFRPWRTCPARVFQLLLHNSCHVLPNLCSAVSSLVCPALLIPRVVLMDEADEAPRPLRRWAHLQRHGLIQSVGLGYWLCESWRGRRPGRQAIRSTIPPTFQRAFLFPSRAALPSLRGSDPPRSGTSPCLVEVVAFDTSECGEMRSYS